MSQARDENVRFVRIRGRVVPIRDKSGAGASPGTAKQRTASPQKRSQPAYRTRSAGERAKAGASKGFESAAAAGSILGVAFSGGNSVRRSIRSGVKGAVVFGALGAATGALSGALFGKRRVRNEKTEKKTAQKKKPLQRGSTTPAVSRREYDPGREYPETFGTETRRTTARERADKGFGFGMVVGGFTGGGMASTMTGAATGFRKARIIGAGAALGGIGVGALAAGTNALVGRRTKEVTYSRNKKTGRKTYDF